MQQNPKDHPPTLASEKFERQKRALQASTRQLFELGRMHGLSSSAVCAIEDALAALGWMPSSMQPKTEDETCKP